MTRQEKKWMWLTTLICLLPMIAGFLVYDQLPEMVPTHFNGNWEPDDYSPKFFAAYGLPLLLAGFNLLLHGGLSLDPKKDAAAVMIKHISYWIFPVVSIMGSTLTLGTGLGYSMGFQKYIPVALGILIMVLGNYLPKCRQNYTIGIKLSWTLHSKENWNFTHRYSGYSWMVLGAMMIVASMLSEGKYAWFMTVIFLLLILVPLGLSLGYYMVKEKKN